MQSLVRHLHAFIRDVRGDIAGNATGQPCWVEGTISDTAGRPVPNARIGVWECDEDGLYDVQYPDGRIGGRAHLYSGANGEYRLRALTPLPYPIPDDGPVGKLRLRRQGVADQAIRPAGGGNSGPGRPRPGQPALDPNPIRHCPGTRGRLTPGKRPASGAGREHDQLLPSPIEKMVLDQ